MKHINIEHYGDGEFFENFLNHILPPLKQTLEKKLDELKPVVYLSVLQASEKLNCSKSAFYNKINKGEINLYKLGKRSVLIESELDEYIKNNKSN